MKNVIALSLRVAISVAVSLAIFVPQAAASIGTGVIAYVNEAPNGVYVISGASSPRRLTPSTPDDQTGPLAWSADGKWLVFADGGLVIVDATNGKARRLTDKADTSPSWDDSGNIWFRRGSDVYRMRLNSPPKKVETECGTGPGEVSPDGNSFAYSTGEEIRVCGTNAAVPDRMLVKTEGGVPALGPRWSPDGQDVAYFTPPGEGERGVFVVDIAGANNDHVGAGAWADWSLDGQTLVFTENDQPSGLMLMDADGKNRRALTAGGSAVRGSAPAWGEKVKPATSGTPMSGDESDENDGGNTDTSGSNDSSEDADRQTGTIQAEPRTSANPDAAAEGTSEKKERSSKKDAKASPNSFAAPETEDGPSRGLLIAGIVGGLAMMGAGSGIGFWLLRRSAAG